MTKRIFDLLLASVIFIFSSPLFLFAMVGIKLTSPGPIFYNATRVGTKGEPFKMHKFRTMHVNDGSGSVITSPNDNRIFPFGAFLRASKIDELPQLLNILIGDMSFVGPRPEDGKIVDTYYNDWMKETLSVQPGLTSPGTLYFMSQFNQTVADENTEVTYAEKILEPKLSRDLEYIKNQNVFSDLILIAKTGFYVLKKMLLLSDKE